MRPNILITGGSGFIGSSVARYLAGDGFDVTLFDKSPPREEDLLGHDCTIVLGDIRDEQALRALFDGSAFHGIVHLAAMSRVVEAEVCGAECISTNVDGTANLLRFARDSQHLRWIIYGSSREVYGEPEALPVGEDSPLRPLNTYGRSKLAAERMMEDFSKENGVACLSLRFSNVYGNEHDIIDRVVPKFIINNLRREPIHIEGGTQVHDFTFIDDTVNGIGTAIDHLEGDGTVDYDCYNIVSGMGTSIWRLADMIAELTGLENRVEVIPPRRYDVMNFVGDPTKAESCLGFKAMVDIQTGLKRTIEALRGLA